MAKIIVGEENGVSEIWLCSEMKDGQMIKAWKIIRTAQNKQRIT